MYKQTNVKNNQSINDYLNNCTILEKNQCKLEKGHLCKIDLTSNKLFTIEFKSITSQFFYELPA